MPQSVHFNPYKNKKMTEAKTTEKKTVTKPTTKKVPKEEIMLKHAQMV